jgi:hypothetical protein
MKTKVRILHLEDSLLDSKLAWQMLVQEGIGCDFSR